MNNVFSTAHRYLILPMFPEQERSTATLSWQHHTAVGMKKFHRVPLQPKEHGYFILAFFILGMKNIVLNKKTSPPLDWWGFNNIGVFYG